MLVKQGKIYYARFQFGDRETWISTHQTTEREAKRIHSRLEIEFKQKRISRKVADAIIDIAKAIVRKEMSVVGVKDALAIVDAQAYAEAYALISSLIPSPPVLASDVWAKYLASDPQLKPSTMETKRQRIEKFIAWAGERDMRQLDAYTARRFLDTLDCGDLTKNHYIGVLSSIWKESPELANPWGEYLRRSVTIKHKQPFTLDQIRAIVVYCRAKNLRFWELATQIAYYSGGRRLKEVVYFNSKSIQNGYIDLLPNKTERTGNRVRVQILPPLQPLLDQLQPDKDGYFFPEAIKRYEKARTNFNKEFTRILQAVEIHVTSAGFGFQSIRHSYVTEGIDAGIETKAIQATAGHGTLEITEGTYYHGIKDADISKLPLL